MTGVDMSARCDLAVRLVTANTLPPDLVADAVGVPFATVVAIADGAATSLTADANDRLALFCAIIVRLEIRFGHDPAQVRAVLDTPHATLDDVVPAAIMARGLEGLRSVHRLAGEITPPAERWWRCASRR